ncbi:DUF3467 domain-containing protein [archaeon]|nr:DUF3467 domain-containing protein [archaeon]
MFDKKRKLNVIPRLKDELFLSNQVDIRFYPDLFKIDFKQLNQQVDRLGDDKHESLVINRRTIALTPLLMKQLSAIINKILADYEKKYGEIKIPDKPRKRKSVKKTVSSTDYIG